MCNHADHAIMDITEFATQLAGRVHLCPVARVVVLEESPRPRRSSRTNLQVLVLVLVLGPQVLVLVLGP